MQPATTVEQTVGIAEPPFEVLAVGTEVAFMGRVDHVTSPDDLDPVWRFYRLPGPVPEVDFDDALVLFYARSDDACPDELVELVVEGTTVTPVFARPPGFCAQPGIPTSYAVAVRRSFVPDRFTAVLPGFFPDNPIGYGRVDHEVDTTRPTGPELPEALVISDVAAIAVATGWAGDDPDYFEFIRPEHFAAILADADHIPPVRDTLGQVAELEPDQVGVLLSARCQGQPLIDRLVSWGPYLTVELATIDGSPCDGGDPFTVLIVVDRAGIDATRHVETSR